MLKIVVEFPQSMVEGFAVKLCKAILPNIGWNGDIMCPPIIENYADHVRISELDKF